MNKNLIEELKDILININFETNELKKQTFLKKLVSFDNIIKIFFSKNFNYIYHYKNTEKNIIQYTYNNIQVKKNLVELFSSFIKNPLEPEKKSNSFIEKTLKEQEKEYIENKKNIDDFLFNLTKNTENDLIFDKITYINEQNNDNYYYSISINQISYGLIKKIKKIEEIEEFYIYFKSSYIQNDKDKFVLTFLNDKFDRIPTRDNNLLEEHLLTNENDLFDTNMFKKTISNLFFNASKTPVCNCMFIIKLKKDISIYKKVLLLDFFEQEGIILSNSTNSFYSINTFDIYCLYA